MKEKIQEISRAFNYLLVIVTQKIDEIIFDSDFGK